MRSLPVLATLVVAGVVAACADSSNVATTEPTAVAAATTVREIDNTQSSRASKNFIAQLSGESEVPRVETKATGVAKLQLSKDGKSLTYFVNVAGLENVRFAHLHLGAAGVNGEVVAFLRMDRVDGPVNGRYAEGTITAANLINGFVNQPLSVLVDAIEAGNIYVNVHTDKVGSGELRGQVR